MSSGIGSDKNSAALSFIEVDKLADKTKQV